MAPWRTSLGTAVLATAVVSHYSNALWSLYAKRSLRMPAWELLQLASGLVMPALLAIHLVGTRVAEEFLAVRPDYPSTLASWWVLAPSIGFLQAIALLVAWGHGCIGLHFWLRNKICYRGAQQYALPLAFLVPALALAGYIAAGNEVRREAGRDPLYVSSVRQAAGYTGPTAEKIDSVVRWGNGVHVLLIMLALGARRIRIAIYHRTRPPVLTLASGRRFVVPPAASVLEVLRDNAIPHAAVCGGRARCTTCRVLVTAGADALPASEALEAKALARIEATPGTRLACQIRPTSDLTVMPLLSADATARDGAVRGGLEGSERLVTVVFVDLRGSTTIGEAKMPYDVLFLLNHFFRAMNLALTETGGHYSQFTGDGLMAIYGLHGDAALGAANAIRGARAMLARVDDLNRQLAGELSRPLRIGIGIHHSEAIVGEMGPPKSQIITAIGDTVNTCARLESLTKDYDCSLIISRQAVEAARLDLTGHVVHQASVKGRIGAVEFIALNEVPELA